MTLRQWYAGQALAGMLARPAPSGGPRKYAKLAFEIADAMLQQSRNETVKEITDGERAVDHNQ